MDPLRDDLLRQVRAAHARRSRAPRTPRIAIVVALALGWLLGAGSVYARCSCDLPPAAARP